MSILAEILAFPLMLIELAGSAMRFSADAFMRVSLSAEAQTAAFTIAFLAGVSEMLGQSVILVVNRIALYRFLASLLFTGFTYIVTALSWGLSALIIAPLTRSGAMLANDIPGLMAVVSLAFAPRLLGIFSMAPYFGVALGNLLEAFAMVLVIFGLYVTFDLPLGAAVVCGGVGWLMSFGLRSFLGRMLARPLGHLRLFISGSPLEKTPQQIIDDLIHTLRNETKE